jgi:probable rRNA maturation factor
MILNRQSRIRVATGPLGSFLLDVKRALRLGSRDVTVCLVSDAEIGRMNRKFRGKPKSTDVLSFPAHGNGTGQSAANLGDIAIAPGVARRNARRFGRTLPEELRVLILHGMLHLVGYDHETDRGEMDRIEHRLRARLGLS